MDMSFSKLQKIVEYREACRASAHGVAKESDTTLQMNRIGTYKTRRNALLA